MKKLKEMAKIITQKRIEKIELLKNTTLSNKGNKLSQLYKGIISEQYQTDEDAAKDLYNSSPSDNRYLVLKHNFKKRLYNNLFYLDVNEPSYSDYKKAFYTCYKNFAMCRILSSHSARESAVELGKKTLNVAIKYKFAEVVIGCAKILKDAAFLDGNLKEHQELINLIEEHEKVLTAELLAENYYQTLAIHYTKSVASKSELTKLATKFLNRLDQMALNYNTLNFQKDYHRIKAFRYEFEGDYKNALMVFEDFEGFLNSNPVFKDETILAYLYTYKVDCYLHLNDFTNGEATAIKALSLYKKTAVNRYIFLEYYFLLSIRTKNYEKATEIFIDVFEYTKFEYFRESIKERWRIYQSYIYWLLEAKVIPATNIPNKISKTFSINDILSNVPIFSKDKRGYNVAILVIQVLFMLIRSEFGRIIDRMDALKLYRSRHLKREEDLRSKVFIKLLMIMEKQAFDFHLTKQKAEKYLEQLSQHPFKYEGTPTDAEIIPYETLWEMVLEILHSQDVKR